MSKELAEAAESLVRRARQGDQNAMGMIAMVRQNAEKGVSQAKSAFAAIRQYISKNPSKNAPMSSTIGFEPKITPRAVKLANGPNLTASRIGAMGSMFGAEANQAVFVIGVEGWRKPRGVNGDHYPSNVNEVKVGVDIHTTTVGADNKKILAASWDTGLARAIQLVRLPNSKISAFSPLAGWELGE